MENNDFIKGVNIKIEPEEYDDSVYHPVEEENVPQLKTSSSNIHEIRMPGPIEEMEVKNEPIEFNEKQMWSPIREITSSGVEIVRIPADENEIEIKDEPLDMENEKEETKSLPINDDKVIQQNIKRLACSECSEKFRRTMALVAHESKVHDIKKFQCDNCSKRFTFKSILLKHIKSGVCQIRPLLFCPICNGRFIHKGSLKKHLKNEHAVDPNDYLAEPTRKDAEIATPNVNDVEVKEEGISMGNVPIDKEMLPTEERNTSG